MSKLSRLESFRQRNEDAPWEVLYFSEQWQPVVKHFESWFKQPIVADSGISREALESVTAMVGLALPLPLREWYRLVGNHPYIQAAVVPGALSPANSIVTRVYTGNVILPVYEPRGTVLGPSFRLNGVGGALYFADYDATYYSAGRYRQFEDCFHPMSSSFEQLMLGVVADSLWRFPRPELWHQDLQSVEYGCLNDAALSRLCDDFGLSNAGLEPPQFWPWFSLHSSVHPSSSMIISKDSNLLSSCE